VLILRLADQAAWPLAAEVAGGVVAGIGLLGCAVLLARAGRARRTALLVLGQTSIAVLAICAGQEEGRFAALVLLVLVALCRSAARITVGPTAVLAVASLGGVPPLGVFPGIALVVLALGRHAPWLLAPLGLAVGPMVLGSVPWRLGQGVGSVPWKLGQGQARLRVTSVAWLPLVAWVPLVLAALAGYGAPDGLVQWWRAMTTGAP
jgi:hypothetical protein